MYLLITQVTPHIMLVTQVAPEGSSLLFFYLSYVSTTPGRLIQLCMFLLVTQIAPYVFVSHTCFHPKMCNLRVFVSLYFRLPYMVQGKHQFLSHYDEMKYHISQTIWLLCWLVVQKIKGSPVYTDLYGEVASHCFSSFYELRCFTLGYYSAYIFRIVYEVQGKLLFFNPFWWTEIPFQPNHMATVLVSILEIQR